jgi:hypothetical protein
MFDSRLILLCVVAAVACHAAFVPIDAPQRNVQDVTANYIDVTIRLLLVRVIPAERFYS